MEKLIVWVIVSNLLRAMLACAVFSSPLLVPIRSTVVPQAPVVAGDTRNAAAGLAARILRADYEGDRAALDRMRNEMAALSSPLESSHPARAARMLYWQAFASWRRAMNGANDNADLADMKQDTERALRDFEKARRLDPTFVEASIGTLGTMQMLAFVNRKDVPLLKELMTRYMKLQGETQAVAADNPRFLWVLGSNQWFTLPGMSDATIDERQSRGAATYERGLAIARAQRGPAADPLTPTWGEPELLTYLAYSRLHQRKPDVAASEAHAKEALALVPYWHYLRDILMPQIQSAKSPRAPALASTVP